MDRSQLWRSVLLERPPPSSSPPESGARRVLQMAWGDVLRTVPLGADHLPRRIGGDPMPGRPYIVTLGTIEPRKNHLRILEAWRRLPAPRPALVVIGRAGWCCAAAVTALREEEQRGNLIWLQGADDRSAFRYLAQRHPGSGRRAGH